MVHARFCGLVERVQAYNPAEYLVQVQAEGLCIVRSSRYYDGPCARIAVSQEEDVSRWHRDVRGVIFPRTRAGDVARGGRGRHVGRRDSEVHFKAFVLRSGRYHN